LKNLYSLLLISFAISFKAAAQVSPYGVVDTADLKMTTCSFEKGANAMVLFDVAKVGYRKYNNDIVMERRKRIKIFNEKGASEANIRLEFWENGAYERFKDIEAVTINLVNNKIQKTFLDPKLIYTEKIDKHHKARVFTLPGVKAGSVIEVRYTWQTNAPLNYPDWQFQTLIPTRYSELHAGFYYLYDFNTIIKANQKFTIDTVVNAEGSMSRAHKWAMANINSFRLEPYMHSIEDNLQSIYFKPIKLNFWGAIATRLLNFQDFGGQLNLSLDKEAEIIANAKSLKTKNEKMAYLFNTVKHTVKWNEEDFCFSDKGIQKAWLNKRGNSTEINLILYHFLKSSGINPSLIVLGTRDNGEIEIDNPGFTRLNKTVVQVPIDSLTYYVLDASGKYNVFNETPYELLGLNMMTINPETKESAIIHLQNGTPSQEAVFVNAQIDATGRLTGNTQISSSDYKRIAKLFIYDKLGEKEYINSSVKGGNTKIDISIFKLQNMESDTLPLREDFNFKLELPGADEKYIYFSPNLFTGIGINPFINESRFSDIDFIYLNNYIINGRYKLPKGYKIDALPKSITIVMPDNTISFKRIVGEMEGDIIVNYMIRFKKARYSKDEYPSLREFYKKMYEMLDEQIVLRKA
jgi:hypothetical protein